MGKPYELDMKIHFEISLKFFMRKKVFFLEQSSSDFGTKRIRMKILQLILFLAVGEGILGKIDEIENEKHEIVEFVSEVTDDLNEKSNDTKDVIMVKLVARRHHYKIDYLFEQISQRVSETNPVLKLQTPKVEKNKALRRASIVIIVTDANHPVSLSLR
jgi:uncharacterized protein (UPF0335 family)